MPTLFLVSYLTLWLVVLACAFLLFALVRQLGLLTWRLEQLAASTPSRMDRNGLKPGVVAPEFLLPDGDGREHSLQRYRGKRVLLVFVHPKCGPCAHLVADLNRLTGRPDLTVLAVSNADRETNARWAAEHHAQFPVLSQERWQVSKLYQSFATPFGFLIDEEGIVTAQGIVSKKQHLDLLFASAREQSLASSATVPASEQRATAQADGAVTAPQ